MDARDFAHVGVHVEWHEPLVILKPHVVSLGDFTRIDSFTKIEGGEGVTLGRWVHVASFAHLNAGGGTIIAEDGANFSTHSMVLGGGATPDGITMSAAAPPYRQHVVKKVTRIGQNASVLAGAIVLGGVTLHEGAIAAAGSVVTHDIPAWEIWAGVPARKLADRQPKTTRLGWMAEQAIAAAAPATKAEVTTALLAGMDEMETWA